MDNLTCLIWILFFEERGGEECFKQVRSNNRKRWMVDMFF